MRSCISLKENSGPQTETKFVQLQKKRSKFDQWCTTCKTIPYTDFNFEAHKILVPPQVSTYSADAGFLLIQSL